VAVIDVAEATFIVDAATPPKVTELTEVKPFPLKYVPVKVLLAPIWPEVGVKEVNVGYARLKLNDEVLFP
jgi:hypothetical protein